MRAVVHREAGRGGGRNGDEQREDMEGVPKFVSNHTRDHKKANSFPCRPFLLGVLIS